MTRSESSSSDRSRLDSSPSSHPRAGNEPSTSAADEGPPRSCSQRVSVPPDRSPPWTCHHVWSPKQPARLPGLGLWSMHGSGMRWRPTWPASPTTSWRRRLCCSFCRTPSWRCARGAGCWSSAGGSACPPSAPTTHGGPSGSTPCCARTPPNRAPMPARRRPGPFASDEGMETLPADAGFREVRTATATVSPRFADAEHWYRWSMSVGQRQFWEGLPGDDRDRVRLELFAAVEGCRDRQGRIGFDQQVRYTLGLR